MKSIASKMSKAAKIAGYGVQKDGKNQAQNYSYTSAAAVKMRCGPALAEVGVAVSSKFEILAVDDVPTRNGGNQQRVMMRVIVTFVCGETGETLSVEGGGSGMDSGDKAIMKAYTAAEKYAYISAFSLALGEDPEDDSEEPPAKAKAAAREKPTAQAPSTERVLADGLRADFAKQVTGVDSMTKWLNANAAPIRSLPEAARTYVFTGCGAHAVKVVGGLTKAAFMDAWNAALMQQGAQS